MKLAVALALALLLAGCGTAADEEPKESPPPIGTDQVPAGEPPATPAAGPPPAWVGTTSGAHWLGFSTYCWGGGCADYVAPSCDASHVPTLVVPQGDQLDLILDFDATSVSLTYVGEDAATIALDPELPGWTAEREGAFSVFATAEEGDASYVGCVRFD
jgi:hypothetical protein